MSSSDKVTLPFGVVPLVVGFGVLLTGVILLFLSFRPDIDATATGSITEIEQGVSSNYVTRCSLNAEFTVDGATYVASSLDASASNCEFQVGDSVVVEYSSANPAVNQIKADYFPWLGAGLMAGGLLLLVLGVVLLIGKLRKGVP